MGPQVAVPRQAAQLGARRQLRVRPVLRLQRVAHHLGSRYNECFDTGTFAGIMCSIDNIEHNTASAGTVDAPTMAMRIVNTTQGRHNQCCQHTVAKSKMQMRLETPAVANSVASRSNSMEDRMAADCRALARGTCATTCRGSASQFCQLGGRILSTSRGGWRHCPCHRKMCKMFGVHCGAAWLSLCICSSVQQRHDSAAPGGCRSE